MWNKLFPMSLDNSYRGYKTALWLLGVNICVRILQSVMVIFNGPNTVRGADGIPLDSYPPDAAQTILGLFAQNSVWRFVVGLLGVLVLVRYRTAVPLMFLLLIVIYLGAQVLAQFMPMARSGWSTGSIVNLVLFGITILGLALSMIERRDRRLA